MFGGSEFVGRAYLEKLIAEGFTVDLVTRGIKPITTKGYRHHFKCNRRDAVALEKHLKHHTYDYIFDISAYTIEDIKPIVKMMDRSRLKRYFFMSTGGVYTPSTAILSEDAQIGFNPNWGNYGTEKRDVERLLLQAHKQENLPILIFRPTYIYGEGNNLYRESYFFQRIEDQLPIPYPDTGNGQTQFIHIDDLVMITLQAMTNEATNGEVFNITNPHIYTWHELMQVLQDVTSTEVSTIQVSQKDLDFLGITSKAFFPFRDITYLLDTQKLQDFGLSIPTISLKEGLERAYRWFGYQEFERKYHQFPQLEKVMMYKTN